MTELYPWHIIGENKDSVPNIKELTIKLIFCIIPNAFVFIHVCLTLYHYIGKYSLKVYIILFKGIHTHMCECIYEFVYVYTFSYEFIYKKIDSIIKSGQFKLAFPYCCMNQYEKYSLEHSIRRISTTAFSLKGVTM